MGIKEIGLAWSILLIGFSCRTASAQVANPELELCRSTGLIALRERDPTVKNVSFDIDGMTVAKANTKVEDTPIKTIVIGASILKEKGDTANFPLLDRRKRQSFADLLYR